MPRKELRLVWRDLSFYAVGGADVARADWRANHLLYPLDWSYQIERPGDYFSPLDERGVPMRELPGNLGLVYLPSRIAGYALGHWNAFVRNPENTASRDAFGLCADWFASQPGGLYRHDFKLIGLDEGWLSCVAQGEGVSVLSRAYMDSGRPEHAAAARLAVAPMFARVEDGGLRDALPDGAPFLEEYPGTIYRHVLNGCLYALVGLLDYHDAGLDEDGRARALAHEIAQGIMANIDAWSQSGWTNYDFVNQAATPGQRRNPNTLTYQLLQAYLTEYLGERLGMEAMTRIGQSWKSAAQSPYRRVRAAAGKVAYRFGHGYVR